MWPLGRQFATGLTLGSWQSNCSGSRIRSKFMPLLAIPFPGHRPRRDRHRPARDPVVRARLRGRAPRRLVLRQASRRPERMVEAVAPAHLGRNGRPHRVGGARRRPRRAARLRALLQFRNLPARTRRRSSPYGAEACRSTAGSSAPPSRSSPSRARGISTSWRCWTSPPPSPRSAFSSAASPTSSTASSGAARPPISPTRSSFPMRAPFRGTRASSTRPSAKGCCSSS